MSNEEKFDLNRTQNIDALVDAFGKQWTVVVNKQNGLCHARPNPDREDAIIPEVMGGQWTKPSLLIPKMRDYVVKTWDMADAKQKKMEREAQAAAEAELQAKKDAKEAERLKAEALAKLEAEEANATPKKKASKAA